MKINGQLSIFEKNVTMSSVRKKSWICILIKKNFRIKIFMFSEGQKSWKIGQIFGEILA